MLSKFGKFFKGFVGNITKDPVSSIKGLFQLGAAGLTCYGMATGTVPITPTNIGIASAFATGGLHSLGSNNLSETKTE